MGLRFLFRLAGLLLVLLLAGCVSSVEQDARAVTNDFWQAVLAKDMESAKQLTTWNSAQYLQLLNSKPLSAQHFETGELQVHNGTAEVATVLYSGETSGVKVPLRTVLVLSDSGWLVDAQKTMGSMVSGTMGTVVEELNSFMQEGLKGLDQSLSESIEVLGQSLEKGLDELKKDLAKPSPEPAKPQGQAI